MNNTQTHEKQVEDLQNLLKNIIHKHEQKTKTRRDESEPLDIVYIEPEDKKEIRENIKELEDKLEKAQKNQWEKNGEIYQEYFKLRRYTDKNGRDREKDEPERIKDRIKRETYEKYLYKPLIEAIEDNDPLDVYDYICSESTPDEIVQKLEDDEREIIDKKSEFIYYYDAIKYLEENDQSLTESLELAKNSGYDLDRLNSCILASLLYTENEDLYWNFERTLDKIKEKAEEMNETREETEKQIEKEIEEETPKAIEEQRTQEQLKQLEEIRAKQEDGRAKNKDFRKIQDALREFKNRNGYKEEQNN